MICQNLDSDSQQNNAAQKFRAHFFVDGTAELHPDGESDEAHEKGYQADDEQWLYKLIRALIPCAGIGNANRQGIDTGCDGQKKLCLQIARAEAGLLFFLEGIGNHLCADKRQHPKGNPMVNRLNVSAEAICQKPADKWHHSLEKAKQKSQSKHRFAFYATYKYPAYYGNGKAIHGYGQCYE